MEVEHFSHPHPLTLNTAERSDDGTDIICAGCEVSISCPIYYTCKSCDDDFFLHQKCFELPKEIKRPFHPKHPLSLRLAQSLPLYGGRICDICKKTCMGFVYHCPLCDFDLDIQCALPPCINYEGGKGHQEHRFICIGNPLSFKSLSFTCSACGIDGNDSPCLCTVCQLTVHQECISLPSTIKTPLHDHPQLIHTFYLQHSESVQQYCGICRLEIDTNYGGYYCPDCEFVAHTQCGKRQWVDLVSLRNFIEISPIIITPRHNHPKLIHTFLLQQCESVKRYCGFCHLEIVAEVGGYYCPDCDFVAHVKCSIKKWRNEQIEAKAEREEEQGINKNDEFMDSAFRIVLEIKHGEEKTITEIKHFSHQHNLVLIDKISDDYLKCDGCMLPISTTPFYGCAECMFFLDKTCVELPRQKKWQHHKHQLTLTSMAWEHDSFYCDACGEYCHGFRYTCERCDKRYDVRCLDFLKESIEHPGHEHPLFLASDSGYYCCSCCGFGATGSFGLFRCGICNFSLHIRCAALPHEARHEYDEHPLFLTSVDPNDYQFVCQICEKERDPKLWFYRCDKCDFDSHRRCVLGKNRYVKLGSAYRYDFHHHPLTLVEKTEKHPECHTCGWPCKDLALECNDSQCNFIIHREGKCVITED